MQVFAPPAAALQTPLQFGPVAMRPHLDYQFSYGNGIQSSPGQQQNSIVQQVAPGVLFNLGDHWALDYTPILHFYSSSSFHNTVDQSVQLSWGTAYRDWFFSGSQGYASSSNPNIQTAAQTGPGNLFDCAQRLVSIQRQDVAGRWVEPESQLTSGAGQARQITCNLRRTPRCGQR